MAGQLLVAGIDFGTSFSKVVLRDQATREAVVVTSPRHPDGLIESLIGINNDFLVPPSACKDFPCVAYLKMLAAHAANGAALDRGPVHVPAALGPMRKEGDGKVILDLLVFYFAHLMATTEEFIRRQSPWRYFDFSGNRKDNLIFQLAVPTGLLDHDGATERLFRKAFLVAYELRGAVDPRMIRPQKYQEWSNHVEGVANAGLKALQAKYPWQCLDYPEVLAAMQTVFRSPNPQQDGLYITMDVGAGTVELNTFRRNTGEHLHPDERAKKSPNHDYYSMKVCPLGLHNLQDPYELVFPLKTEEELAHELHSEVSTLFLRAKVKQPNHPGAPGTRTWDRARFLIFGGGAQVSPYRKTFREALEHEGIHVPQIFALPAASDLPLPEGVDFGRFAVAYGISFFRQNLDSWRPPEEILPFNTLYPPDETPPSQYGINWED